MIKCNIHPRKKIFKIKAKGTPKDLTKETLAIICEMYSQIKKVDEPSAEKFRSVLFALLIDPNSPVLNPPE